MPLRARYARCPEPGAQLLWISGANRRYRDVATPGTLDSKVGIPRDHSRHSLALSAAPLVIERVHDEDLVDPPGLLENSL
jgi:hypothetical protein